MAPMIERSDRGGWAWDPLAHGTVALGFLKRAVWPAGTLLRAGTAELAVAGLKS